MQFEEWAAKHEFWKSSTRDAMERAWDRLTSAGVEHFVVFDVLDEVMAAMRNEYGD